MSKSKIRQEKNCLNCNTEVLSKFCPQCGQQNVDPKLSLKELLHDFLHDLTHFDGKFFSTSKLLITKPGFLSTEFVLGKRASYLHPVRMCVFTSAIFFYLFYTFFFDIDNQAKQGLNAVSKRELVEVMNKTLKDSTKRFSLQDGFILRSNKDTMFDLSQEAVFEKLKDSLLSNGIGSKNHDSETSFLVINDSSDNARFPSVEAYNKFQASLNNAKRDGYLESFWKRREIRIINYFKENKTKAVFDLIEKFTHSLPSIMFLSLPLIAMVLSILFFNRIGHSYVGNAIFLLHLYVFTFFFTLLIFLNNWLSEFFHYTFENLLNTAFFLTIIFYGYKAMKNYYSLTRTKAIFKYLFFLISSSVIMLSLFILYFL